MNSLSYTPINSMVTKSSDNIFSVISLSHEDDDKGNENGSRCIIIKNDSEDDSDRDDNTFTPSFSSLTSNDGSSNSDNCSSDASVDASSIEDSVSENCSSSEITHSDLSFGCDGCNEEAEEESAMVTSTSTNNTIITSTPSANLNYYVVVRVKSTFASRTSTSSSMDDDDNSTASSLTMSSSSTLSSNDVGYDYEDSDEGCDGNENRLGFEFLIPVLPDSVHHCEDTGSMMDITSSTADSGNGNDLDDASEETIVKENDPVEITGRPQPPPKSNLKRYYSRSSLTHCSSRHKFLRLINDNRQKKRKEETKEKCCASCSTASLSIPRQDQEGENDSQMLDRIMQLTLLS